jgi:hypothetical protein
VSRAGGRWWAGGVAWHLTASLHSCWMHSWICWLGTMNRCEGVHVCVWGGGGDGGEP